MFLGPLLHDRTQFELPYAGGCDLGTRTVEPHMSALRPFGLEVKATEGSYHAQVDTNGRPGPADRADRARRHRDRERPARGRPPPRHHRDPQRQPELHGAGPLLLPHQARACEIDGIGTTTLTVTGVERHRRRRRLRAVGGPDRGDEPARRRDRHRVRDHDPPGADRVPRDRARAARGDGLPVRPHRGVPRRQRPHPARRPDHARVDAARADRQDPPDAVPRPQHRQPAVLRGHRGDGAAARR